VRIKRGDAETQRNGGRHDYRWVAQKATKWFCLLCILSVSALKLQMELDFDKEINALLRHAGKGGNATAGDTEQVHLDADEISAFAENALPERSRQAYVRHLAGCDRCRKLLSEAISMNSEAVVATASSVAAPAVPQENIPWYRKIFLMPNLAAVMGGLVLIFAGFLGYLALQNSPGSQSVEVSEIAEEQRTASGPNAGDEPVSSAPESYSTSTTANSNTAVNRTTTLSNSANSAAVGFSNTTNSNAATAVKDSPITVDGLSVAGRSVRADQPAITSADTAAAAPPPKPEARDEKNAVAQDKDKQKKLSSETENELSKREATELKPDSRSAKTQSMKSAGGPYRQQQNTFPNAMPQNQAAGARRVGGKSFEQNQNVWYDSAYQGQKTTNVRRGTDEYKKLDAGLRSIADSLGGTVVIVWKEKAYRIQ